MPTVSKIPQAEWDKHKDRLYALYITDDRQLEEVVERAKLELGFFASKAQYIRQFGKGKWDFKKNFRKEEWKAISHEVSKRKFRDKDSEVWLNNSRVPSKRLRKEISRYGLHTRNQHENEITLDADSGIVVRTPPAEARPPINYIHIPWVHFLSLTEPYFQSIRTLSPQESQANAPRDLALQLHDTRSAWTGVQHGSDWNSAFPNDSQWTIDPLQHGTFDSSSSPHSNPGDGYDSIFPLFDNSTSIHLSSLSPYEAKSSMTIVEASIRALSFLADTSRPLTESTLQGFEDQVRTYQEDLAIGVPDPDSRTVRLGSPECLLRLMSFLVYLSSNNLRADGVRPEFNILSALDTLVRWLHNSRTEWVLWLFLDLKTSTTEVFGSMVFRSAAKLGLTEIVQKLIYKGVDVNSVEGDSLERETALKLAVTHNHIEIVRLLLKAGADLKPCKGALFLDSILYRALNGPDRIEMMQTLLQYGADVNEYENFDYSGELEYAEGSVLIYAISSQDHAMARLLLEAGAHVNAVDEYSSSPLHTAVENEDIKMVQILIGKGADVNGMSEMASVDQPGSNLIEPLFATPIQLASRANNTKLVKMLLDKGADPCRVVQQKTCCNDYEGNFPTALQSAVDDMNTVMVEMLLKAHADVNDRASALGPPLAIAAANADLKLVRILLRHGSHINAPAERFYKSATALQAAAETGDLEVIKELLDSGADLNADAGPIIGRTALQAAAEEGIFELVKFFMSKDADLNASPSIERGVTCLAAAVGQGHVDLALFLLENGAYVNSPPAARSGEVTALQAALKLFIRDDHYQKVDETKEHSHIGLVKTLINAGADLNSPCSPGRSLSTLTIAVLSGQSDLVDLLLENGLDPNQCVSYRSPLGEAVAQGDSNLVRCLINARTDVDALYEIERNSYGTSAEFQNGFCGTPLQVAAAKGYVEIAQLLLEAGAEIGVVQQPSLSHNALQYAVEQNHTHMVKFLLDKGANPNIFVGWSPLEIGLLHYSAPNLEVIAALIDAGADTNPNPTNGHKPTSFLLTRLVGKRGGFELVNLLLKRGATVNEPYRGMTTLQSVPKCDTVGVVEVLLNAGAHVNEPAGGVLRRTALQDATERGDLEMVNLLLSRGANVNAPAAREYGITALQGAMRKGSLKMVLTLLEAGANINDEPAAVNGRTALEAAAEWGRLDIVHLLLSNDKEPDNIEARCKRAAKFAEDKHHTTIARDLRQHRPR